MYQPLKPMTFGEILDATFKLYRDQFGTFVTLAAVLSAPPNILFNMLAGSINTPQVGGAPPNTGPMRLFLLAMIPWFFALFVSHCVLLTAASQAILGEPLSVGGALRRVWSRFGALLSGGLWMTFFSFLCAIPLMVPGLIYFLRRSLYANAAIVEGVNGGAAIKRSKKLIGRIRGGRMDRIFGAFLIFGMLGWATYFGVHAVLPASLIKMPFVGSLLSVIPNMLVIPLQPIVLTLIYFDARVRDEGFALGEAAAATPATVAVAARTA
jgi:hypothetical protein